MDPLHDGWASRKALIALGLLVAGFSVASAAMFLKLATFAEWADFLKLYVPSVFGLFAAGEVAQKLGLAKAQQ